MNYSVKSHNLSWIEIFLQQKYKDQAEKGHQQYVEAMKQYKKL